MSSSDGKKYADPNKRFSGDGTIKSSQSSDSADNTTTSTTTTSTVLPPMRPRLYSEEDEELRLAKKVALAAKQNPDLTPDQLHQMHLGDEFQSQLVKKSTSKHGTTTTTTNRTSTLKESFISQQKKAKERFQTIMVNSSTTSTTTNSSPKPSTDLHQQQQQQQTRVKTVGTYSPSTSSSYSMGQQEQQRTRTKSADSQSSSGRSRLSPIPSRGSSSSIARSKTEPVRGAVISPSAVAKVVAEKTGGSSPAVAIKTGTTNTTTPALLEDTSTTTTTTTTLTMTQEEDVDIAVKRKRPSVWQNMGLQGSDNKLVIDPNEKIIVSGVIWKRRSGFGKLSYTKAWERRKIILQGSKLIYFVVNGEEDDEDDGDDGDMKQTTWLEQAAKNMEKARDTWLPVADNPSTPRGFLDLVKEKCTVGAAAGHSGAPSPFAISIKDKGVTIWKLCFDTHAEQMKWLAALTDVVVTSSVDSYNANLVLAADPSQESGIFTPSGGGYMPPPPQSDQDAPHRLWMMDSYNVSSDHLEDNENEVVVAPVGTKQVAPAESDVTATDTMSEKEEEQAEISITDDGNRWILQEREVNAIVATVNVALFFSHSSSTSPEGFWYVLVFCNIGLLLCLAKDFKRKPRAVDRMPSIKMSRVKPVQEEEQVLIEEEAAVTIAHKKYKPMAGTTTIKLQKPTDSPEIDGQIFGGWCAPSGNMLAVRAHGYLTSKTKIQSPGELYECIHMDIFESPRRYPEMAKRVQLPKVEFEGDDDDANAGPKTWHSPDLFIVSIALPTDPAKIGGSKNDGGGYTLTMYFKMHQETRDILRRVTSDSYNLLEEPQPRDVQKSKVNAVKLFEEWCKRAPSDPAFQSRFKLVPNAQNLKEIGVPSWIAKYNGKPVLIKRPGQTGFLFPHPELSCIEFDISLHPFPYLAKQAICYMKDNFFSRVLVSFGFVIEGRSDEELPECLIGLVQLCYPDPKWAIQAHDFFANKSPKSF